MKGDVPPIDSPVGPHSDAHDIHEWLDELAQLRQEYEGSSAAIEQIDQEVARAIGWLHGQKELSGKGS